MKLSTKGRYAVTALADIALNGADRARSRWRISRRVRTSRLAYLEQLVRQAAPERTWSNRSAGRAAATTWRQHPRDIKIAAVMSAVDETPRCDGVRGALRGRQGLRESRTRPVLTHHLWEELSAHVHVFLHSQRSIGDVIENRTRRVRGPQMTSSRSSTSRRCWFRDRPGTVSASIWIMERHGAFAARGARRDARGDGRGGEPVLGPCRGARGQEDHREGPRAGSGAGGV